MCVEFVLPCFSEYWQNASVRNQAHLLLAESGFFYRKAEMLNRMIEVKHKQNARKNMNIAIMRAENVRLLGKATEMKEVMQAEKFMAVMRATPIHVRSVIATDWRLQRSKHDTATSSDLTLSSSSDREYQPLRGHEATVYEMEVRSTTREQQEQEARHRQAMIQLDVQLVQKLETEDADSDREV